MIANIDLEAPMSRDTEAWSRGHWWRMLQGQNKHCEKNKRLKIKPWLFYTDIKLTTKMKHTNVISLSISERSVFFLLSQE